MDLNNVDTLENAYLHLFARKNPDLNNDVTLPSAFNVTYKYFLVASDWDTR